MQEIVPKLCDFHNDDIFRDDIKNVFFNCITLSLRALYPKMNSHDFDTFRVPIDQTWRQTVLKLRTIVDMEIRKHFIGRGQSSALNLFSDKFIQMAAIVVYIVKRYIKYYSHMDVNWAYINICRLTGIRNCKQLPLSRRRRPANVYESITWRKSSNWLTSRKRNLMSYGKPISIIAICI